MIPVKDVTRKKVNASSKIFERVFILKGDQPSPVCTSGKSNVYVRITVEHWGKIMPGENGRTRRENCPSATLPTKKATCTELASNPGMYCERPGNDRQHHDTLCGEETDWNHI
jgi:hypothetical protein